MQTKKPAARVPLSPKKDAKHNILREDPSSSPAKVPTRSPLKRIKTTALMSSPLLRPPSSGLPMSSPAQAQLQHPPSLRTPRLLSSPLKRPLSGTSIETPRSQMAPVMRENSTSPRKRASATRSLSMPVGRSGSSQPDQSSVRPLLFLTPPAVPPISPSPLKQDAPMADAEARRAILGVKADHPLSASQRASLPPNAAQRPASMSVETARNDLQALLTPPRPRLAYASLTTLPDPTATAPARLTTCNCHSSPFTVFADATVYPATVNHAFEQGVGVDKENEGAHLKGHRYPLRSSTRCILV